jgi:sulfur carrier protein
MILDMSDAARETLEIHVNGEPRALSAPATVSALIEALGLGGRRVAVAINRDVVPRSQFASRELAHGDRVEILQAVGGGA